MADADDAHALEPKTEVSIERFAENGFRQEMIFEILLRLPAQVLHDLMSHVCREWNLMIRSGYFIHHHLRNSTSGIIIQNPCSDRNMIYVEMRGGCLEISKFDDGFRDLVWTSCNGLVLAPHSRHPQVLYVINPLTKRRAVLPHFHKMGCHSDFGLAFVEASMEYKVVCGCRSECYGPRTLIAVLTVGVDKVWRRIDIKHLFLTTESTLIHLRTLGHLPLVAGGYVHWIGENFVLSLNAETEAVCRFPKPPLPKLCGRFLPMGNNLSFVSESHESSWDVWEMNPETGEWTMLLSFDLEPLRYRFKDVFCEYAMSLIPLGWLADREVLFLSTLHFQRYGIAYNVKTKEIQSFELDPSTERHHFRAHVNSLVWLEGGF